MDAVGDPGPDRQRLTEQGDPTAQSRRKLLGGGARPLPPPGGGREAYLRECESIAGYIWGLAKAPNSVLRFREGHVVHSRDLAMQLAHEGKLPPGEAGELVVRDACQMLENLGVIRVTVRSRDDSFCFVLSEEGAKKEKAG